MKYQHLSEAERKRRLKLDLLESEQLQYQQFLINGAAASGGGGSTGETVIVSPLIDSWYNGLAVKPSADLLTSLNTLVDSLNTAGKWTEYDYLLVVAGMETQEQRLKPLISTAGLAATPISSPTLNATGAVGNSVGYLDLNWNPFLHASKYALNSASLGSYVSDFQDSFTTKRIMGAFKSTAPTSAAMISFASNLYSCSMNTVTASAPNLAATTGLVWAFRTTASNVNMKVNSTLGTPVNTASTALTNLSFFGMGTNVNGLGATSSVNNCTVRDFHVGSSLLSSDDLVRQCFNVFYASRGLTTF